MEYFNFNFAGANIILCIAGKHVTINYSGDVRYHDFEDALEARNFYQNTIFNICKAI